MQHGRGGGHRGQLGTGWGCTGGGGKAHPTPCLQDAEGGGARTWRSGAWRTLPGHLEAPQRPGWTPAPCRGGD